MVDSPRGPRPEPDRPPSRSSTRDHRGSAVTTDTRKHIVAINNSDEILVVLDDLLTAAGYRVTTQLYRDHSIAEVASHRPDLIILDYQWASDDAGWTLLQLLRLYPDTTNIPIVLCTAAVEYVAETRDHLDVMDIAVVYKPFDIRQLLATLRDRLARADAGPHRDGTPHHDEL